MFFMRPTTFQGLKLKIGFIQREGVTPFYDFVVRLNFPRIPLFLVISPVKGHVDVFRNVFTGEIK